ncbi:hypothetical protein C3920_11075 [Novacetimonas pomaceti]|uniref:Uncharacterized protein n=1 Tax=Novacetimonas pomaceti TaxID=2021998 RepID=A0ABX5P355_9PROT|nr:hypothetical protein C3920_11075 [Novacetimonas pomaceti]
MVKLFTKSFERHRLSEKRRYPETCVISGRPQRPGAPQGTPISASRRRRSVTSRPSSRGLGAASITTPSASSMG